jgi:bacteriorhodopsin
MSRAQPLSAMLQMLAGPVIWFAHFVVLYGAEALICTPPLESSGAMTSVTIAATVAALVALGIFAAIVMRQFTAASRNHTDAGFLRVASLFLALLSAIAVIWVALPTAILPVCAAPAG